MPTQPMFDDLYSQYEYQARQQLGLDDDWFLETIAAAVSVGIDDQIELLSAEVELSDGERWRELDTSKAPRAWLPKGFMLITMRKRGEGEQPTKAGFIQTQKISNPPDTP